MFTGIIEGLGLVKNLDGSVLNVELPITDAVLGESIAINGVCLTVTAVNTNTSCHSFDLNPETLEKTNLSKLKTGSYVNFERALRLSDRLSGHIVQGHIDGVGKITQIIPVGDSYELEVSIPKPLRRFTIPKGSIALDGISLTINSISEASTGDCHIRVMIIPHTWKHTNLVYRKPGDYFNIEADMIAKLIVHNGLKGYL